MKKMFICIMMMLCLGVNNSSSQTIQREGNTFTQVTTKKESKETLTEYVYKDSKGVEYPIYLSSSGKAFIKKVSKKTGKEYKQYVPEIGKQINPEAYKEKK